MNRRIDKLNSEFKKYITEILQKKVKDPRLTEMFTILDVVCDKELSTAKVFVSIYSTDAHKSAQTFVAIKDSEPFVRSQISKAMHIRTVPQFKFMLDESLAYSQRINEVLNEIMPKDNN
ncbi:MAG: 30S ribosome-binding factor RbfA [Corallococcus sp.]|nr:30S ribosome-binding factor RbfA [Corallococcus sp.]